MEIDFGVYLRQPDWTVDQLRQFVTLCEDLGYYGIYTNDHLTGFDKSVKGKEPYLDAWTFISTVLSWSSKLRAGHTVLCQSFRPPALLAKQVASLDILSGGRFDLFMGAGWKEDEYLAYGYPFDPVRVRFRQLEEYFTILRNSFDPTVEEWDFEGEFWTLKDHRNFPKPATQPFPIHLGGVKPLITKLGARIADGFNTVGMTGFEETIPIFKLYEEELQKLGIDPTKRIKSFFGGIRLFKHEEEMREYAKKVIEGNPNIKFSPEELAKKSAWGTPEILAEKIRSFVKQTRVHFLILAFRSSYGNPVELFWDEVRPLI